MTRSSGDPGPIDVERDGRTAPEPDAEPRVEDEREDKRGKGRRKRDRDRSGERNVGG